jgi:hypothetical protein
MANNKVKNILVYTQWPFYDGLNLSYVVPCLYMIRKAIPADSKIYFATQEKDLALLQRPEVQTIIAELNKNNIFHYPEKYYNLGIKKALSLPLNFLKLLFFIFSKKINVIHTEAMSAGMIGTLLKTFTGKKHIVDSYEPLAYSMVEAGIWPADSFAFKLVKYFEKRQAIKGDVIIGTTNAMQEYAHAKYGITLKNFYWKPAIVDTTKFNFYEAYRNEFRKKYNLENKKVIVYAGKFGGQYLENETFDFFKACHNYWGDDFRILLLTSHTDKEVEDYCTKAKLDINIITKMFVPFPEMYKYLSIADFAITPVKPIHSKRYCSPIKDGEYWATGLPVVVTENISDDSDIIQNENIGTIITDYSAEGYLKNIKAIETLLASDTSENVRNRIREVGIKYRHFDIAEKVYIDVYTKILNEY